MNVGQMTSAHGLDQTTVVPVGLAPFPGPGSVSAPLCLTTNQDEYGNVLEIKSEPFYTLEESATEVDMDYIYDTSLHSGAESTEMVTPEEEERRKLRRERNKVAASKCRQKRKQHVRNLVQVSEALEVQNNTLQSQITKLHDEIKQLEFMLDSHSCSRHASGGHGNNNDELSLSLSQ
ncbi:jun dimerization protein 2 isoform X2 [Nematostella vectensis]|uniref:jun dimerization protein 2 isoform X2 n=1 Tax=Nematostella vectensis TaxID=45351 RepID=UPI0013905C0D|nr:jun dimerization protein 2 isoform X2 [Nematostella vectensis]